MKIIKTIITIFLLILIILSGCVYEYHYDITNPNTATEAHTPSTTPIITPEPTFQVKETYVEKNGTRVYLESNRASKIIGILYSGDIVTLVGADKECFLIEYNDIKGYVYYTDLTIYPTEYEAVDLEGYEFIYPNIVIIKSLRIFELWDDRTLIFTCSAQIGQSADGDKQVLGDKKTPEGRYYISSLNPGTKYYKSMYISYPNAQDAEEAYSNGIIDESTKDSIVYAARTLTQPPFDTPLGGFISIHGQPNEEGYTAGCIAIPNDYMDMLWQYCPVGTQVNILP